MGKQIHTIRLFIKRNKLLFVSFLLLLGISIKIWSMNFPVADFSNTVLSMASSRNIDISQLIKWYYFYAIPCSFFFIFALLRSDAWICWKNYISRAKVENVSGIRTGNLFFILGLLFFHGLVADKNWINNIVCIAILIFICLVYKYGTIKNIIGDLVVGIEMFLAFIPFVFWVGIYIGKSVSLIIFLSLLLISYYYTLMRKLSLNKIGNFIHIFLWASICDVVILYIFEILLLRGYEVAEAYLLFPYLIAWGYWRFLYEASNKSAHCFEKNNIWLILVLLLGTAIPPLGQSFPVDFFEGANHGLSIQEAINGWGIPLFNNLDAHLLSQTIGGLFYYYVTGDYTGSLFAPYSQLFIIGMGITGLYYVLREYLDKEKLILLFFLFPWGIIQSIFPGLIAIPVFLWWKRHNSLLADIGVILTFVVLCFYRIDIGASFGVSLILLPLIYNIAKRNYERIVQYIITGIFIACGVLLICYEVAQYAGSNLLLITEQFLNAFLSNQNWGYGRLGSLQSAYWLYFIFPIIASGLMIPYISRLKKEYCMDNSYWIIIFLYITYVLSWSRALVRHNMVEYSPAAYALPLLLLILFSIQFIDENYNYGICLISEAGGKIKTLGKYKARILLVLFLALLAISVKGMTHGNFSFITHFANVYESMESIHQKKRGFYRLTEDDEKQVLELKSFFDANLHDDQTYFDFTNQSLFFAFTDRKNPIYINQCPGMINGKQGQIHALKEIMQVQPPFVLMPYKERAKGGYGASIELDGILNSDRYYLIFEYIAENYRPFCQVGDFAVWCKKNQYSTLMAQENTLQVKRKYLTYTYGPKRMHHHKLGWIPYLWGQYAAEEDQVGKYIPLEKGGDSWSILPQYIGKRGFLVITIQAVEEECVNVRLYGGTMPNILYTFNVKPGKNQYRLRVSSDALWYSGDIKQLEIKTDHSAVESVNFQEVEGDMI